MVPEATKQKTLHKKIIQYYFYFNNSKIIFCNVFFLVRTS